MNRMTVWLGTGVPALVVLMGAGVAHARDCAVNSTLVGPTCVDKYESSVWETTDAALVQKIKAKSVTLQDLTAAAARQRGLAPNDFGAACPATGKGCMNVYAVSVPGVRPSTFITWFQAVATARNSGKRLLSNAEWQAAALGSPDGVPCVVTGTHPQPTGTAGCVSDVGVFDMTGNVWEFTSEWVPLSGGDCPSWGSFSTNQMCLSGADAEAQGPGVLVRGGSIGYADGAGVFAVRGDWGPARGRMPVGFRMGY